MRGADKIKNIREIAYRNTSDILYLLHAFTLIKPKFQHKKEALAQILEDIEEKFLFSSLFI